MRLTYLVPPLAALSLICSCSFLGGTNDVPEDLQEDANVELSACSDGLSQAEIDAEVELAVEFQTSMHELYVCGGLTVQICVALTEIIFDELTGVGASAPAGFTFMGDGVYQAGTDNGPNSTDMQLMFLTPVDRSFAAAGEPVPHDLFNFGNYLVGAQVSGDVVSGEFEISYSETGPLVELLGLGADPPNPIPVTLDSSLGAPLTNLEVVGDIVVSDHYAGSQIDFTVHVDQEPVSSAIAGVGMSVDEIAGSSDLGQDLTVSSWDVEYADSDMNGHVVFDVRGAALPYDGVIEYEQGGYGELTLTCP